MQRDTPQLRENDTFWVAFDTFNDRLQVGALPSGAGGGLGHSVPPHGAPENERSYLTPVPISAGRRGLVVKVNRLFRL